MINTGYFMRVLLAVLIAALSPVFPDNTHTWANDAIWYQIFPDRFYNGDRENDPTKESLYGVWPWEHQQEWELSPWTSDWYEFQPWEIANGQPFNYQFQIRRYGGDIQGIIDKLDYLQDLGVNALYLNPVFQSPSSHKYGAESYRHIDRFFGPDPEGDRLIAESEDPLDPATWQWTAADKLFLKLVQEVHARGMRIIIDGVFNHAGLTFWAFQDVIQNGSASPYYYWYNIKGSGGEDFSHLNEYVPLPPAFKNPGIETLEYTGYVSDLPAFRQDKDGPVEPVRNHFWNIVRRWGDPNGDGDPSDGIDGWRLDVAERVQLNFWREFRKLVKSINPEAYITGEVWWEDYWNNKQFNAAPWLEGDAFDGVMNYRFGDAMFKFLIDEKNQILPTELDSILSQMEADHRPETNRIMQSMLGSHDMERLGSAVVNPDRWIDHGNSLQWNKDFDIRKPNAAEWEKFKAIITFQFTYLGAPFIYYGDEAGMWGADDPDCRKPMLWEEFSYDDETAHPCDNDPGCEFRRPRDEVSVNRKILATYKELIGLRKEYSALRYGSRETIFADDKSRIFAYLRKYGNESVLVVFNGSDQPVTLPRKLFNDNNWRLKFSSSSAFSMKRQLRAKSAKIYISRL